MSALRGGRVIAVLVVTLAVACTWILTRSAATVSRTSIPVLTVDTSRPGHMFAAGSVGFSTEARELSSGRLGAGHTSLARLMRLLGPSVLRIGGNSVDRSAWIGRGESPPRWATATVTPADLSRLRGLLAATGWRVLLGVNLGHFEPTRAADEARVAREILGPYLLGIEIGNEPNSFSRPTNKLRSATYSVSEYLREAGVYGRALTAAAPGVPIYGPALSQIRWLIEIGASASIFNEITQHFYPATVCPVAPDAIAQQPTVGDILSPAVRREEDETLNTLAQVGVLAHRSTRIGETGDGPCGGNSGGGPTFASALWSLDWALRAANSGVEGLSFHGHLGVCGYDNQSPVCARDSKAANAGAATPRPEYYGMLAASRLEGGRFVPTTLTASHPLLNLTAWATVTPSGTVRIAIDNLATTGAAQPVSIPMSGYTATQQVLVAPTADARSRITLGAAPVTNKGRWRPKPVRLLRKGSSFRVVVRPASAVIITLRRKHSRH